MEYITALFIVFIVVSIVIDEVRKRKIKKDLPKEITIDKSKFISLKEVEGLTEEKKKYWASFCIEGAYYDEKLEAFILYRIV